MKSNLRRVRPRLATEWSWALGRDLDEVFPESGFQPMPTQLFTAGIPIVENIDGGIDRILNLCQDPAAMPWRFRGGKAAMVPLVAFVP